MLVHHAMMRGNARRLKRIGQGIIFSFKQKRCAAAPVDSGIQPIAELPGLLQQRIDSLYRLRIGE